MNGLLVTLERDGFREVTENTFHKLASDETFADVTLACDDGQQLKAHRVILAACSPFFRNILSQNLHPHPLLYVQGVDIKHLKSLLDFIYLGKVLICDRELQSFQETGKRLKIEGLQERVIELEDSDTENILAGPAELSFDKPKSPESPESQESQDFNVLVTHVLETESTQDIEPHDWVDVKDDTTVPENIPNVPSEPSNEQNNDKEVNETNAFLETPGKAVPTIVERPKRKSRGEPSYVVGKRQSPRTSSSTENHQQQIRVTQKPKKNNGKSKAFIVAKKEDSENNMTTVELKDIVEPFQATTCTELVVIESPKPLALSINESLSEIINGTETPEGNPVVDNAENEDKDEYPNNPDFKEKIDLTSLELINTTETSSEAVMMKACEVEEHYSPEPENNVESSKVLLEETYEEPNVKKNVPKVENDQLEEQNSPQLDNSSELYETAVEESNLELISKKDSLEEDHVLQTMDVEEQSDMTEQSTSKSVLEEDFMEQINKVEEQIKKYHKAIEHELEAQSGPNENELFVEKGILENVASTDPQIDQGWSEQPKLEIDEKDTKENYPVDPVLQSSHNSQNSQDIQNDLEKPDDSLDGLLESLGDSDSDSELDFDGRNSDPDDGSFVVDVMDDYLMFDMDNVNLIPTEDTAFTKLLDFIDPGDSDAEEKDPKEKDATKEDTEENYTEEKETQGKYAEEDQNGQSGGIQKREEIQDEDVLDEVVVKVPEGGEECLENADNTDTAEVLAEISDNLTADLLDLFGSDSETIPLPNTNSDANIQDSSKDIKEPEKPTKSAPEPLPCDKKDSKKRRMLPSWMKTDGSDPKYFRPNDVFVQPVKINKIPKKDNKPATTDDKKSARTEEYGYNYTEIFQECDRCEFKSDERKIVTKHRRYEHNKELYVCKMILCKREFSQFGALLTHRKGLH